MTLFIQKLKLVFIYHYKILLAHSLRKCMFGSKKSLKKCDLSFLFVAYAKENQEKKTNRLRIAEALFGKRKKGAIKTDPLFMKFLFVN